MEELQQARRLLRWSYCLLFTLPPSTEGLEPMQKRRSECTRDFILQEQGSLESVTECLQENVESLAVAQLFDEFHSSEELNQLTINSVELIRRLRFSLDWSCRRFRTDVDHEMNDVLMR